MSKKFEDDERVLHIISALLVAMFFAAFLFSRCTPDPVSACIKFCGGIDHYSGQEKTGYFEVTCKCVR